MERSEQFNKAWVIDKLTPEAKQYIADQLYKATERSAKRKKRIADRRAGKSTLKLTHKTLTRLNVPGKKDGNKLGLKARTEMIKFLMQPPAISSSDGHGTTVNSIRE